MICGLTLSSASLAQADGSSEAIAQNAAKLYQQGLVAEKNGQIDTARTSYEGALAIQPRHGNARYRLLNLKSKRKELSLMVQKRKLQKVIIPSAQFTDASLAESLEALSALVAQNDKEKTGINIVLQDPDGVLDHKKINIQLRGVPASAILDYILQQGSASASYDAYAVVIKPLANRKKSGSIK